MRIAATKKKVVQKQDKQEMMGKVVDVGARNHRQVGCAVCQGWGFFEFASLKRVPPEGYRSVKNG
jgi:hypothetical protein